MEKTILCIQIAVFIFELLVILKNAVSFARVMMTEDGKLDTSTFSQINLGCAISIVITLIIYWCL